jgi:hypothetical protein
VTDAEETAEQVPAAGLDVQLAAELIERAKKQGVSLVGPDGLLAGITKTVLQAALDAEMSEHRGYEKGERPAQPGGNHRNGRSPKTVLTEVGSVPLLRGGSEGHACLAAQSRLAADPELVAPEWTLYAVAADEVEFWQADQDRRHTRLRCTRDGALWTRHRLWP